MLTRRDLFARAGVVLAHPRSALRPLAMAATTVPWQRAAAAPAEVVLEAAPATLQLADDGGPPLPVWSYNARSPGPILRYQVGDTARLRVRNQLTQPTTVHWHGMRVPFAMDGVPGISQQPIAPGAEFLYEFPVRNPGTFWYHPHFQSAEQLDRGLHGAIVVDDADQEVTHVVRGLDLQPATAIHRLLQELLGFAAPVYHHHALIRDALGNKLSKSDAATSLRSLREAGWSPADVIGRLGLEGLSG